MPNVPKLCFGEGGLGLIAMFLNLVTPDLAVFSSLPPSLFKQLCQDS